MAPSSRWVSGGCGSRRGGYHRRPQQTYRRTTPAAPKPAKQAAAAAPKSLAGLSMGKPGTGSDPADKRPSRFRPAPTQAFNIIYERALEQRFFVLSRTRTGTDHCPEEVVEITGSTGNIYNVYIRQAPRCTCPHSMKGNQCKHILYVRNIFADPCQASAGHGVSNSNVGQRGETLPVHNGCLSSHLMPRCITEGSMTVGSTSPRFLDSTSLLNTRSKHRHPVANHIRPRSWPGSSEHAST